MRTIACQYSKTHYSSFDHPPPPAASLGSPSTSPHAVMLGVFQSTVIVQTLAIFFQ